MTVVASKYELLEMAGEGGMAKVWRAVMRWAAGFSRQVAVKQILPNLTSNRKFVAMFIEEARVGSQLQHPNIVQILDFGMDKRGAYFLVMEWVDGLDLGRWINAHARAVKQTPWPLVCAIGVEALRGLNTAHRRIDQWGRKAPVVHRDVTPQNILIGTNGIVKLTDFGLSRAKDRAKMTHPKIIKGKLRYLAPEVAWGKEATPRSDLFCLGIVLWEALACRQMYRGTTDVDVFVSARNAEIPPLRECRGDLPEELYALMDRALNKDAAGRFGSAEEMLRALTTLLRNQPDSTDAFILSGSVIEARKVLGLRPAAPPPEPPPPPVPAAVDDPEGPEGPEEPGAAEQ